MSQIQSENAAKDAQIAYLKGQLAVSRADNGHLRARLAIVNERAWSGQVRGIQALCQLGKPAYDPTGFAPDGLI